MPSTFETEHRRELLILDTGPIRELVLFHAVDQYGSFRTITTSASVVAELNYWIRKTETTGQEKLWNRVYEEFREMRMDELVVKLLEMDRGQVTAFGPVDISLLEIARRNGDRSPLVLTVDGPLHRQCAQAGFRAKHLVEIALAD